jgi:hypothetical protein
LACIALLLGLSVPGAAQASTTDAKCGAFVILITVRGVNAPAGTDPQNGRVWLSGGNGAQLDPLVQDFKLLSQYPVWTESLAWDANISDNNIYAAQVNTGMNLLTQEIMSIIQSCPVIPHIFLAGHSGGADIVTRTLTNLAGSGYESFISGSVVYGDPSTNPNQHWNAAGVSASTGFFHRTDAQTTAINNGYRYYGWSYDNPSIVNPTYYPTVRAYCNTNDWACRNPIAGLWNDPAHNAYTSKTQDAYNWLNYLITDQG